MLIDADTNKDFYDTLKQAGSTEREGVANIKAVSHNQYNLNAYLLRDGANQSQQRINVIDEIRKSRRGSNANIQIENESLLDEEYKTPTQMKSALRTLNEDPRSQIGKYLMDNSLYRNPSSLEHLGHNSKLGLGLTDHQKRLKP